MMMARYSMFGSYLMNITELQQVQPHTLLRFAKASKRCTVCNLKVILGLLIWAETDYDLSAGQHAILPEGKGETAVTASKS